MFCRRVEKAVGEGKGVVACLDWEVGQGFCTPARQKVQRQVHLSKTNKQ